MPEVSRTAKKQRGGARVSTAAPKRVARVPKKNTARHGNGKAAAIVAARKRRAAARKHTPAAARRALAHSLAQATRIQKGDYTYLVHPLLDGVPRCEPALLQEWVAWAVKQPLVRDATVIAAPEAMALPVAAALSLATGLPYTVLRKRSYGLPGEVAAPAATGYGAATLHINDLGPRDAVLVVDNVLSTGGTLGAILAACKTAAIPVLGAIVVIDKGTSRKKLEAAHGVPILAMHWIKVDRRGVALLDP